MTEGTAGVFREKGYELRPSKGLLHRIVDNLIEVHSMPNDFVSVIQPTAAKNSEEAGVEGSAKRPAPVLPVRDTVLFPHAVLPLTVGRESSIQLIQSLGEEKTILVVAQRDARQDSPQAADLYAHRNAGDRAQGREDAEPEPLRVYGGQ